MNQPGKEIGPMLVGELQFDSGLVTICDHWTVWPEEGVTLAVRPGNYRIFVNGKDFGGERRIASVSLIDRLCRTQELRTQEVGEVDVDSWGVIIGQYRAWHDALPEAAQEGLGETQFGTYPDGCELFDLVAGGQRIQVARSFTGFGSGAYPVESLWDRDQCVGLVCEFIYQVS